MSSNPANPGNLPVLVNLDTQERYVLDGPLVTFGRAPENHIVLPDDGYASASHAKIFFDQGRWWLEDLMSSNGTAVNDQIISSLHALMPQDRIKVGRTTFRIE